MGDKINTEYFAPAAAAFNFNNVTGGAESASGGSAGSGGSGMECLQLRSPPPGPFHYLISEQAKSLVALQELQNEVGALLEFRDLVIETFPNLRCKMAPSMPAAARREWEPGVRVRRKLAAPGDTTRAKPQPSVQDSGFSTETSCGKDVNSASASRSRPLEDELWALLDVIQRKGVRLREEAESLRSELDVKLDEGETAEESFARALSESECNCSESRRLREERDALLARAAQLEAAVISGRGGLVPGGAGAGAGAASPATPLGRLDRVLATPLRSPRVPTPDAKKFAAILQESNPVELQRQLLTSTVQTQVLSERLRVAAGQRGALLDKLERARDVNDDLKFQLEEKTIELEGARAIVRQLEKRTPPPPSRARSPSRDSMRDMEPVTIPDDERDERITDTPRRARPSRIPLPGAGRARGPGGAPARASCSPARPASALSAASGRSRHSASSLSRGRVPVRRPAPAPAQPPPPPETKKIEEHGNKRGEGGSFHDSLNYVTSDAASLAAEYVARASRLAAHRLFSRLAPAPPPPPPPPLALELARSLLYGGGELAALADLASMTSHGDELWHGKPQHYFESMRYSEDRRAPRPPPPRDFECDSLAP